MVTGSGGGRKREPGEMWTIQLKDATSLDDAGYVLMLVTENSVQKVDKCDSSAPPYAVNYRSTRDPSKIDEPPSVFLTGSQIGTMGITVFRDGWANLKLATNNAAINVGDPLVCTGGGKVDKYVPTTLSSTSTAALKTGVDARFDELSRIVGHAEEKVAQGNSSGPAQDKIMAKLSIRSVSITS